MAPSSHSDEKSGGVVTTQGPSDTNMPNSRSLRAGETSRSRLFKSINLPVLHLGSCLALSFCMVYVLDGYLAVPTESPRRVNGQFKLKVSDVTTIISAVLTIVKIIVGAWAGTIIWNCAFILLEKRGLTLPQVNRIMSFYVPPLPKSYTEGLVVLLLFLVIPQQLISPLLSGAVDWSPSFDYSTTLQSTAAGSPESNPLSWFWYYYITADRRGSVRRAAGMTTLAWGVSAPDRQHSRHVLNDDPSRSIPINSTLYNAVVPCIQIHSITFPTAPPLELVFTIANNSVYNIEEDPTRLSRAEEAPLRYGVMGNAVLFDPNDRPGLFDELPHHDDGTFVMDRPADYMHTGLMYAVIHLGVPGVDGPGVECAKFNTNIFGTTSNNQWPTVDHGNYDWCATYAIVNLTAGIATSETSTYISGRVVETDLQNTDLDIRGGPWVKEAMYLMPDVMSNVAMMNTTSLYTWEDMEGYIDKLIRYSYQGTWDMLSRTYDDEPKTLKLDVRYYQTRVLASVSHVRVFAWLGISILLTLSAAVLVLGKKGLCERGIVFDGPVAALLTDPAEVLRRQGRGLTGLSHVTKEDGLGSVMIQGNVAGGFHLVPIDE